MCKWFVSNLSAVILFDIRRPLDENMLFLLIGLYIDFYHIMIDTVESLN